LWIATAINEQAADILVLTEYVERGDHASFLDALKAKGLCEFSSTIQPGRENQVLIATRGTHRRRELIIPEIHRSVPSNILRVVLEGVALTVIGFRMPAFDDKDRPLKRMVWNWLLGEADRVRGSSAIIVGDFNTAPGDSRAKCGDCLEELVQAGWQHPRPESGCSWRSPTGVERQIDHIFLSDSLCPKRVEYKWSFEQLAPFGTSRKVGSPDHAMLVCDFDRAAQGRAATP
jgi:hypothetical protein